VTTAEDLVRRAREETAPAGNRFLDLLQAGRVPRERLTWPAGEALRAARMLHAYEIAFWEVLAQGLRAVRLTR
jgi:hypothetical protein